MKLKKILSALFATILVATTLSAFSALADDGVISVGKSYTLEYSTPIENAYPLKEYKPENKLTDGQIDKTASYSNSAWVELYRGTSVNVTIDLGETMAVSRVTLGELQAKQPGIVCSRYVEVYVSEDGENFGFAGRIDDPSKTMLSSVCRVEFNVKLDKSYKARYVKVVFSSDVFTYVDEISVYGNSNVASAVSAEITKEPEEIGFAKPIDGISNICLMYTASSYTTQTIKPYFAYIDSKGNATDLMFDSLLFLAMPKTTSQDGIMKKADFEAFVSEAFASDKNIGALNTVVGELKDDLNLGDDYKYPIFVSLPFIDVTSNAFGEIDGKNVFPNNFESRKAIVNWYIDHVISTYEASGYENIELKGVYWFAESVKYTLSVYEEELMKHFNEYAHSKGLKTIWIPYYTSAGIDKVPELGFDAVTMQSGYAFNGGSETGQPLPECVFDCAKTAKKYGMGMEFEVDMNVSGYIDKFRQYVRVAYTEGLMTDGIMMMYQVGDHLYRSSVGNASQRELYDLTYLYNSGKYKESAPVIKSGTTLTLKVDSYVNAKLEITDEDTPRSQLKIAEIEKPEGVFFAAEGNGFVEAQSYGCQPGTYTARFSVTDGFNVSNTVEVTIIVEPSEDALTEDSSTGENDSGENDNNLTTILIIVGIVVAVAVVAIVIVLVIKKRSKDK